MRNFLWNKWKTFQWTTELTTIPLTAYQWTTFNAKCNWIPSNFKFVWIFSIKITLWFRKCDFRQLLISNFLAVLQILVLRKIQILSDFGKKRIAYHDNAFTARKIVGANVRQFRIQKIFGASWQHVFRSGVMKSFGKFMTYLW